MLGQHYTLDIKPTNKINRLIVCAPVPSSSRLGRALHHPSYHRNHHFRPTPTPQTAHPAAQQATSAHPIAFARFGIILSVTCAPGHIGRGGAAVAVVGQGVERMRRVFMRGGNCAPAPPVWLPMHTCTYFYIYSTQLRERHLCVQGVSVIKCY